MKLARLDTLFLRLFLLMWVTLVLSHFISFSAVRSSLDNRAPPPPPGHAQMPFGPPPDGADPGPRMLVMPRLGTLPPQNLPMQALLLDYGVRAAVIALAALLGARWLTRPMQRLSHAAEGLAARLARGQAPMRLDEGAGTQEVRAAARVFNTMALRLQEQFDARGMHMAALSHDLRTPLTRLRMRLEDAPSPLADSAGADINEMSEMIESTLAVMREQHEGLAPAPLDLRSLLEALADDHREAGHDVRLADGGSAIGRARPAALRRILDNLVSNALRYGGSAELALAADADGATITVDDRGPGIPAAQIELAFQPWVRLTEAHDAAHDGRHARAGHGLGLAIARDLAEHDGGRLTLANRPEGGLRATLWLPSRA